MTEESAIHLKNRTNADVAKQLCVPKLTTRPPIQRQNCWTAKDNTDMIDTAVRGWSCSPIYIMNRIHDDGSTEDEVFDGAHKLEAVFAFLSEESFELQKVHESSPLFPFIGKKFQQLSPQLQTKIKNYKFTINNIDPETADDPDLLSLLWQRLNKAGKQLNDFELALPIMGDLVNKVLKPNLDLFLESELFHKKESKRGQAEQLMQIILALSGGSYVDPAEAPEFTCKKDIIKRWQKTALGNKISDIQSTIEKNKEKWIGILKRAHAYMKHLKSLGTFHNEAGECILEHAHRNTEMVFILARLTYHFQKVEEFRRISEEISKVLKENYFQTVSRNDKGRNGGFQRTLLLMIDQDIRDVIKPRGPRIFSQEQREAAMILQKGTCTLCKKPMYPWQQIDADHIRPWSMGGDTVLENCQMIHHECHKKKGAGIDKF